ncbi:hypothetical protein DQ04_26661000, partial [Trypanosoma grayi]|uniref:hypothetical protein n=1 Tax=Trypanosoma grayi TaxID=71804 RepID=UPI0004F496E6
CGPMPAPAGHRGLQRAPNAEAFAPGTGAHFWPKGPFGHTQAARGNTTPSPPAREKKNALGWGAFLPFSLRPVGLREKVVFWGGPGAAARLTAGRAAAFANGKGFLKDPHAKQRPVAADPPLAPRALSWLARGA